MTRDLYDSISSYRADIDYFSQVASEWLTVDLKVAIFGNGSDATTAQKELSETWLAQPAIVATELALARLWMRNGITPSCVVGHSIGEITAACIAGIFSIETAIELAIHRGRLLQDLPRGKMLAVTLSESELQKRLPNELSLAVVNSPQHTVASGPTEAIEAFATQLENEEVACRVLHTSHAFHSPMMEPATATFRDIVAKHERKSPQLPIASTVTGTWASQNEMTEPDYWAKNIRQTVRFSQAATALIERAVNIHLEVGPGQTLSSLIRLQPEMDGQTIRTTRHPKESTNDVDQWMKSYAKIWASGAKVDWPKDANPNPRRVSLPTYPFQRKRHWIEDAAPGSVAAATQQQSSSASFASSAPQLVNAEIATALPQQHEPFDDWFYAQTWEPKPASPPPITEPAEWLLLVGPYDDAADLVQRLTDAGHHCTTAQLGSSYSKPQANRFNLDPDQPEDFDRLLKDLSENGHFPSRIVHLSQWHDSDAIDPGSSDWTELLDAQQSLGLYSLQFLAQSLGRFRLDQPVQLSIITSGHASAFTADSKLNQPLTITPGRATLIGAAKVIPIEYPQIACRIVDVPTARGDLAYDELLSPPDDVWVAYRDGERCVPGVVRYPLDESYANTKRLKEGGTYLVTGGLGGIGFTIAKFLLTSVRANVALLGRSELPESSKWDRWIAKHGDDDGTSQKIARLRELESLPGQVAHYSANVSDESQLRDLVPKIINKFGAINGIVHTAGVADTAGAIQLRDKQATERMLQSKVRGTFALQAVLADQPLDFWVLFSSISNVLYHNRYGQLSYVAGNSFLEAFAARMQQSGTHAVAIASDEWQSIGMAAEVARDFAESFGNSKQLFDPLDSFTPEQGAEMFQRILSSESPAVLISTRDLKQRIELDIHAKSPFLEAAREDQNSSLSSTDTGVAASSGLTGHRRIAEMWEGLLSIPKVSPDDNYFELGGDSLSAVRFLAELGKEFGQQLPFATMVEFPTPAKLATHLGLNDADSTAVQDASVSARRSTLTEIETNSGKPRLFCMHAADGYVLIFRELAKRLRDNYSVYGLQSPALFGDEVESIEKLATCYVHDIRKVQPQGPYLLTGYCMGGTIALEVAQQLKAEGEQAVLICIETYNWCTSQAANDSTGVKFVYYLQKLDFHFRNFWKLGLQDKLAFLREKMKVVNRRKDIWISKITKRSTDLDDSAQQSAAEIWERHDEIAELYQPKTYDGKIVLFRPQKDYLRYQDRGFPATEEVELHRMPVYPAGMMVDPFVEQLATKFAACLREEESRLE